MWMESTDPGLGNQVNLELARQRALLSGAVRRPRTVGEWLEDDFIALRPADRVDVAATLMEWERLDAIPVINDERELLGVISYRDIVSLVSRGVDSDQAQDMRVALIMQTELPTVSADLSAAVAIARMREHDISYLPVVDGPVLLGMLTQEQLLLAGADLLEGALATSD